MKRQTSRFMPIVLLVAGCTVGAAAQNTRTTNLHYAPNHNFDGESHYLPGEIGFNLADIGNVEQLNLLPNGIEGLVWIGRCEGVNANFLKAVEPFVGKPKVFGFFLMDDPDPTGRYSSPCTPENLKAESDWIHEHAPGTRTFIVLMKLSSSKAPSFADTYNPSNSHVDLFGIDPYPCRTEMTDCDYEMIDRYVVAAEAWGIPRSKMVPVYQAFGGGNWRNDSGGKYVLPSEKQLEQIIARWEKLIPAPAFDFAYSWGSQRSDEALENSPDLQAVFERHNNAFGQ